MRDLTADELTAWTKDSQRVAYCVKIDLTTDLLYTSFPGGMEISTDVYEWRGLEIGEFTADEPGRADLSIFIDDEDGEIATAWYAERFSGAPVTVKELHMKNLDTVDVVTTFSFTEVRSVVWVCRTAQRSSRGVFRLNLSGAGGLVPRAGGATGSRLDFPSAPEPGELIKAGPTGFAVG